MSEEKRIRESYGLSQPSMALYLDVSLSLLKMVETGNRSLPTAALLKLSAIAVYEAKEAATVPEQKVISTKTNVSTPGYKKINRAVRKYELLLYTTQRQLEKMQKGNEQAQRLLALCNYLLQQAPANKSEVLWLEAQQIEAKLKLKRYSLEEQTFLQWKIACLQFGIEKATEMLPASAQHS